MEVTKNQFRAEENVIRENLQRAGYESCDIDVYIDSLRCSDPLKRAQRNIAIREVAEVMRGKFCALQVWYVEEVISKVAGLTPLYIKRISSLTDPTSILRKRA